MKSTLDLDAVCDLKRAHKTLAALQTGTVPGTLNFGRTADCSGLPLQIGNLQAVAQFLCNFSKSVSGTMADILSPARMVIFGTLLTTLNKPMFALSGWVFASFGTVATLYWITAGMKCIQHHLTLTLLLYVHFIQGRRKQ